MLSRAATNAEMFEFRPAVELSVHAHPLGKLGVHHEVMDVLLGPGELQLPADDGHEQRRTARALKRPKAQSERTFESGREERE